MKSTILNPKKDGSKEIMCCMEYVVFLWVSRLFLLLK